MAGSPALLPDGTTILWETGFRFGTYSGDPDLVAVGPEGVAWTAVLARLRQRLLALPDRLAPLCHEETTIAGARDQIRRAVREALDELAEQPVAAAPDPDGPGAGGAGGAAGAGDPAAAAGADDQ